MTRLALIALALLILAAGLLGLRGASAQNRQSPPTWDYATLEIAPPTDTYVWRPASGQELAIEVSDAQREYTSEREEQEIATHQLYRQLGGAEKESTLVDILGQDGWELVTIRGRGMDTYIFKRPGNASGW